MTSLSTVGVSSDVRVETQGNPDAKAFTDKVDEDLNGYLAWGQKNLSASAFTAFNSHMRITAAHLRLGAASINRLNQCPFVIQAQTHQALDILHAAANEFSASQVPYAKNKAAVTARRGEIDRDIERMNKQFARLDIVADHTLSFPSEKVLGRCLAEHPLIETDSYLQDKKIAPKVAKSFADKTEVSEQDFRDELVRVMKDDIKLPLASVAVILDTALTDCAKKK